MIVKCIRSYKDGNTKLFVKGNTYTIRERDCAILCFEYTADDGKEWIIEMHPCDALRHFIMVEDD